MSALGSGCTCPTAFIAHCPRQRFQRIQFSGVFQLCPSLNGWDCNHLGSIGLGVHAGQRSLRPQALCELAPIWPSLAAAILWSLG